MVLCEISCKIGCLGKKNWSFVSKTVNKSTLNGTISVMSSNWFLSELMLIWAIITFFEFVNFKFFNTLFSLFVFLDLFIFRILLVEIYSQFFAFDNLEYVGSIFLFVRASRKYRKEIVNNNYLKNI